MPKPDLDAQIERLYALPLEEFTAARNALAKELKQPQVKALEKPNVAAWAVNQLYWRFRDDYERLVAAADRLRGEHRKLLAGKAADIRDSEKAHRDAIRHAGDRIRDLLRDSGHALSDQTLTAVQGTLEALPSTDPPGRLTRPLKPLGFEALAGVAVNPQARPQLRVVPPRPSAESKTAPPDAKRERELAQQRKREERERKRRHQQAENELKAAEAAMLRAEDAVRKAEKQLGELRAARDEAVSEYQRARLRAHE